MYSFYFFQQQGVIFIDIAHSGMMYNMQNTPIATENQPGNHQMPMPYMQGYYGQQPTILPDNQQQACHSHGNQMPIQGYYDQQPGNVINKQQRPGHSQGNQMTIQGYNGQQPPSFATANQHQNINAQQF